MHEISHAMMARRDLRKTSSRKIYDFLLNSTDFGLEITNTHCAKV